MNYHLYKKRVESICRDLTRLRNTVSGGAGRDAVRDRVDDAIEGLRLSVKELKEPEKYVQKEVPVEVSDPVLDEDDVELESE